MKVIRLLLVCLLLMLAAPVFAQDNLSPYDNALQRIESARESGATSLELSFMELTELPPDIGVLTDLQQLIITANMNLTTLPPEIGQLANLQELTLSENGLTSIPPEIGQLRNLRTLVLDFNYLAELPPEIGELSNLEVLILIHNRLTELPSEIGQLGNLKFLWVGSNQIGSLPDELWQLTNLEALILDNNELSSLSSKIGNFRNLCTLNLRNNNLHRLPPVLGQLTNLTNREGDCEYEAHINLDENPLISPPPEVVEQGTEAILAYLRNQAWYHMQRWIIGIAAGVGLIAAIMLGFRLRQQGRKSKKKRDD